MQVPEAPTASKFACAWFYASVGLDAPAMCTSNGSVFWTLAYKLFVVEDDRRADSLVY